MLQYLYFNSQVYHWESVTICLSELLRITLHGMLQNK